MKFSRFLFMAGAALVFANTAIASNTVDEANRLKSELTPFGAERAGNTDGTIPNGKVATPRLTATIGPTVSAVTRLRLKNQF